MCRLKTRMTLENKTESMKLASRLGQLGENSANWRRIIFEEIFGGVFYLKF